MARTALGFALVLTAVGCAHGRPAGPASVADRFEELPAPQFAAPAAVATPARAEVEREVLPPPRVSLLGDAADVFEVGSKGLPAVSEDGRFVAVGYVAEDGARGDPNFRLVVRDVDTDAVAHEIVVLEPGELPRLVAAGRKTLREHLDEKLAEVNEYLSGRAWVPLAHATGPMSAPSCDGSERELQAGPVEVRFDEPRLVVTHGDGVLLDRKVAEWSAAPVSVGPVACSNAAYLSDVRVDVARRTLLVTTSYCGTDTCWEPNSVSHALRLP